MVSIDEERVIGIEPHPHFAQGGLHPDVPADGDTDTPAQESPSNTTPPVADSNAKRAAGFKTGRALPWFIPNSAEPGGTLLSFTGVVGARKAQPWILSVVSAVSSKLGWAAPSMLPDGHGDLNLGEEVLRIESLHRCTVLWARWKLLQNFPGIENVSIIDDRLGSKVYEDLQRYCKPVSESWLLIPNPTTL